MIVRDGLREIRPLGDQLWGTDNDHCLHPTDRDWGSLSITERHPRRGMAVKSFGFSGPVFGSLLSDRGAVDRGVIRDACVADRFGVTRRMSGVHARVAVAWLRGVTRAVRAHVTPRNAPIEGSAVTPRNARISTGGTSRANDRVSEQEGGGRQDLDLPPPGGDARPPGPADPAGGRRPPGLADPGAARARGGPRSSRPRETIAALFDDACDAEMARLVRPVERRRGRARGRLGADGPVQRPGTLDDRRRRSTSSATPCARSPATSTSP